MKVIILRIEDEHKEKLKAKAKALGLNLTAFCRMILLKALKEGGNSEKS